jgi:virginiamycin A acetyltransferase
MKGFIKVVMNGLAFVIVHPLVSLYFLGSRIAGAEAVFPAWSQGMALLPGKTGVYLRRAFYRQILPECETGSWIGFGTIFSHPTAEIGRNVYVGPFCCLGDVKLEDEVLIGSHVSIANGTRQHGTERLDVPIREQPGVWPRITIGYDTWIGDRAIVLADVGKHCVIGAGAVVVKAIPDYAVAVGNPAKVVRFRNEQLSIHDASAEEMP